MAASFFFYDLETSGLSPRDARIMQFAGIRTDMNLQPIGEPVNVLIKLTPDILPEPDAVMLTGITPQQTIADGLSEAEFLSFFFDEVVKPDTIFLGYNTVRFDDEFMRFTLYRNFYDAYEWQWLDRCSRWDVLDLVRMTRALRPDGIQWPVTEEGKPTNRLELLTKDNCLDHDQAHDALSDVRATIAVAGLIRDKQPKLFDYLLRARGKKAVKELIQDGHPFTYTAGKYPSDVLHTTVVMQVAEHARGDSAIVFDLRQDPTPFIGMSVEELAESWRYNPDRTQPRSPLKTLKYNRCPALTIGVPKDEQTLERLKLSTEDIMSHAAVIKSSQPAFGEKLLAAAALLDTEQEARGITNEQSVDDQLYDGFFDRQSKEMMSVVRAAPPSEIGDLISKIPDKRLKGLLPLYKARNNPQALTSEEREIWDAYCADKLLGNHTKGTMKIYFNRLSELSKTPNLTENQRYLIEELQLYGESIVPADVTE